MDPKSRKAILLGYGEKVKGYRLYDIKEKKVFHSRDVLFQEMKFKESKKTKLERIEETEEATEESLLRTDAVVLPDMTNSESESEDANYDNETNEEDQNNAVRRSTRMRKTPEYYGEWVNIASISEEPKTVSEALSSEKSKEWT